MNILKGISCQMNYNPGKCDTYDTKGRLILHEIKKNNKYELTRASSMLSGRKNITFIF
jgi:hypothetical protein